MKLMRWKTLLLAMSLWWTTGIALSAPGIANESIADSLIEFAIEPWHPANPGTGLIRWPVPPSVTLYFLADNMSAEEATAVEYVNDFRHKCSCISAVGVAGHGDEIKRKQNDILILIDKNGFANFLDKTPEEIKSTFGSALAMEEKFPRVSPISRSTTETSFRSSFDQRHVLAVTVVISANEKLEGLRSMLGYILLAGLNPGLVQSADMIHRYVKKETIANEEMQVPTPEAYDLLRHLFDSRVVPGMTPEEVRLIGW